MVRDTRDKNDNSVKWDRRFDFVDAQIAMVRGRLIETKDGYRRVYIGMQTYGKNDPDYDDALPEFLAHVKARHQLNKLLILRLGMSVGTDTMVESAVTQVLNWKDGER